jgi:predicted acyltransferase
LKHAPDVGLTFPDIGPPAFLFAIGLTFGLTFYHRAQRDGNSAAVGHFVRRYLAFLGMGAIVSAGETAFGLNVSGVDWGVLQAIGGAGLITLIVISLPAKYRLGLGLGLLAVYQVLLNTFWLTLVLRSPHGGLPGTLSWSALLIIATVFGDLYHSANARRHLPLAAILFLLAGFALRDVAPVSKDRVSASYDLITLGVSALIFFEFYATKFRLNYFSAWGKNPILLYGLSYPLTALFSLPNVPAWHVEAPLWLAGVQALSLLLILGSLALYWQRKGFVFSM